MGGIEPASGAMRLGQMFQTFIAFGCAFRRADRGNVAMIFALSLLPLTIAAGTGLDFSRAMIVRTRMASALDAAGLAVGASHGLSQSQIQKLAQSYFDANYKLDKAFGIPTKITVTTTTNSVTLSAAAQVPTTLMNVAGIKSIPVSFSSKVVWGQTLLWVSLVLDNTGSMSERDNGGTSKIDALKTASHQLLALLQNASANPGDVKVSIVPFNRDVNIGRANLLATWFDWTAWDAANATKKCGSGNEDGGYRGRWHGYYGHKNDDKKRRGCTPSVDHTLWNGCIMDRTQNYDTLTTTPTISNPATLFPTDQYQYCPVQLLGLTYDWRALSDKIDSMFATGNTNQTIGLAWGWQTLTDGDPMNAGTLPQNTHRIIILLSDGLNTQNRWTTSQSSIDARERLACSNAKADGILIYTVFVDLNGTSGNSAALENCASDPAKYFDLKSSGEIVTAFNTIGQQITNLRVSQ